MRWNNTLLAIWLKWRSAKFFLNICSEIFWVNQKVLPIWFTYLVTCPDFCGLTSDSMKNSSSQNQLAKLLENLNRSRIRSEAEHKRFMVVLKKYKNFFIGRNCLQLNARSDTAVSSSVVASRTVNEPVQDVQRVAENSTGLSATQLGLNLASDAFTEDELIEQIVSPQKSSGPPLDNMKIIETKKGCFKQILWLLAGSARVNKSKGKGLEKKEKGKGEIRAEACSYGIQCWLITLG